MDENQYHHILEKAEEFKVKGKHRDAINLCEKILLNDLNFTDAFEEIGDNYLSLREYEKAKIALQRAILLNPYSANANYLLGFTYSSTGEWKKSIEYLEKADQIQNNHPEILRCLGWSIFHFGQRKRGIIILERSLNLAPRDILILCDLGVCYLNDCNFDRAINLFEKALDIEPDNQKARECLETAKFFSKEYRKLNRK